MDTLDIIESMGDCLPNGWTVLELGWNKDGEQFVLAMKRSEAGSFQFASWACTRSDTGEAVTFWGHYYDRMTAAARDFTRRCGY